MTDDVRYYYREYTNTHQVYLNRRLQTIENFIDEIPIIEECIGFQFWLDGQVAEIINSKEEQFRKINVETPNIAKQLVIAFSLYRRNHQYLFSAYELAYAGLCEPTYNILRTVHESILALWYITTHPDESTDVIEYMYDNKRKGVQYSHHHFLNSLYIGEIAQSMKQQYSELSMKAHSNVFGMKNTEQYDLEQIKDCFWFIKTLSFYNIVSNVETLAQNSDLNKLVLGKEVVSFIERLKNTIAGKSKTIPNYFPNKGNWKNQFFLYRPE